MIPSEGEQWGRDNLPRHMYNIYKDLIVPFGIGSLTLTQTLPQTGCPSSVVDVSSTLALSWREEGGVNGGSNSDPHFFHQHTTYDCSIKPSILGGLMNANKYSNHPEISLTLQLSKYKPSVPGSALFQQQNGKMKPFWTSEGTLNWSRVPNMCGFCVTLPCSSHVFHVSTILHQKDFSPLHFKLGASWSK